MAEQFTRSSDAADQAQLLEGSGELAARDRAIAAMLADPAARRQEAVAEAELNVSYAGSAITSDAERTEATARPWRPDSGCPPRSRCRPGAAAGHLHQLTHRRGHTLLLLADGEADPAALATLRAQLEADDAATAPARALVEAVVAVRLEESSGLGLGPLTLLAVRPDGFIGLRADSDHRQALRRYRQLVLGR